MLEALLGTLGQMDVPARCDVTILVVENDEVPRTKAVATTFRAENGVPLIYAHEPELGIPFARNRAAREAISIGADLLAFVDDDEEVARDWLVRLIDGYRQSDAVLLGAPLRLRPPTGKPLNLSQRMMFGSLSARYERKEERAARRATLNATPSVTIVTNNWLGEVGLFRDHGIWFDEKLRFTGGTDSKLYAEVRQRGLSTGWVKDAFVYETVPHSRLSFIYQFRRGRDQSNTNYHRRIQKNPMVRLGLLVSVPLRLLSVGALVVALPLTMGRTYADIARNLGWIVGRITASIGMRSSLYQNVTGS